MVQFIAICISLVWWRTSCCDGQRILRNTGMITRIQQEQQQVPLIDDIIFADPDLTTLAAAFQLAAFDGSFLCTTECNSTFLAPTNMAFNQLNPNYLKKLLSPSWILHLRNLLALHVTVPNVNGLRLWSTDWVDGQQLQMLNQEVVTIHDLKSGISVSNRLTESSNLVEVDLTVTNGVLLHKIDTVLLPMFVAVDVFALGVHFHNDFQILTAMLESIGLVGIRSEFTLFAPTDAAFMALEKDVLDELRNDKVKLRKLLVNHVIFGVHPSLYFTDGLVLNSLGGMNISIALSDDIVTDSTVPSLPNRTADFTAGRNIPLTVNGVQVLFTL